MKFLDKIAIGILKKTFSGNYSLSDPTFVRAFEILGRKEDYVGAIYAAIDTWGLYFSKAVFRLYKEGEKTEELKNHDALKLFKRPNSYQQWWEIAYKIAAHWGLWGSSFIYIIRDSKKPVAYQQLQPLFIKRISKTKVLDYYDYDDGKTKKVIAPEDIIDLRYPHPNSELDGHPIISSVLDQKEVQALQMGYMRKFYEKGGFVGLAFSTTTEMKKVNFDRALEKLEERYSGKDNAFGVGLFDSGLQPLKDPYSIRDMDMSNSRKLTKDDIYEAWKVSRIHVGGGEAANRASNDAAIYQFTSGVIDPVLTYVDAVLTGYVRREFGSDLMIEHDTLAPRDMEGKIKFYEFGLKNAIITINEVRDEEQWDKLPYELADVPLLNVGGGAIRIDQAKMIGSESEKEESPEGDQETDSVKNTNPVRNGLDDYYTLKWKQFDRHYQRSARRFNTAIDGYTDSQRRRILEAVKDNFVVEGVFNLEEEDMILWQLLEIEVMSIFEAGYRYGAFQYDISPTFNPTLFNETFNKIGQNSLSLNSTTLGLLNNFNGMPKDEVSDKLNGIYGSRGEQLAFTATSSALNSGILQAMRDAGLFNKIWITMRDSRVRDTKFENHIKMDGVKIPINDYFNVSSRKGFDLMLYPGDPNGSPENLINDRCTIIGE